MAENVVEIKLLFSGASEAAAGLKVTADRMGDLAVAGRGVSGIASPLASVSRAAAGLGSQSVVVSGLSAALGGLSAAAAPVGRLAHELVSLSGVGGPLGRLSGIVSSVARAVSRTGPAGVEAASGVAELSAATSGAADATSSFNDSLNTTATVTGANLQILSKLAKGFATAGGAAFVAAGVMASFGIKTARLVQDLQNISSATGLTIRDLQNLRAVSEDMGFAETSLEDAVRTFNRTIAEGNPLLAKLGIVSKDTKTALLQTSQAFDLSESSINKSKAAQVLFGRGSTDLIRLIEALTVALGEADTQLEKSGRHFSGPTIEAANKLNKSIRSLGDEWKAFGSALGKVGIPIATAILSVFNQVFVAISGFFKELRAGTIGVLEDLSKVKEAADGIKVPELPLPSENKGERRTQHGVISIPGVEVTADRQKGPLDTEGLFDPDKKVKMSDRETRIQRLIKDSGFAREAVLRLIVAIEAEEKAERRLVALRELGFKDAERDQFGSSVANPVNVGETPNWERPRTEMEKLRKTFEELQVTMKRVADDPALDIMAEKVAEATQAGQFEMMAEIWKESLNAMGADAEEFADRVKKAMERARDKAQDKEKEKRDRDEWRRNWRNQAEDAREMMEDLLGRARLFKESFQVITRAMENEIGQSFGNILRGTQSFKSALTNLWRAIKDAIVQMVGVIIARVIAMLIILPILTAIFTAITGNPILGANLAGTAVTGAGMGTRSRTQANTSPESSVQSNVTNLTIMTYDARDTVMELMSPAGMFRRANQRISAMATY